MSIINQLRTILQSVQSGTFTVVEQLLDQALSYYAQLLALIQREVPLRWDSLWPQTWPVELSGLCRARLIPNPTSPDVSRDEVQTAVQCWHQVLVKLLAPFCEATGLDNIRVLSGSNFVNDLLFSIANAADLDCLIQAWNITQPARIRAQASDPRNLEEVFACMLYAIENPAAENKFYVHDPQLLQDILNAAGPNGANLPSQRSLGGAAGNTAFVLSNLGIEVDVWGPYLSDELKWAELRGASYLDLNPNPPRRIQIQPKADLPAKTTVGFQFIASPPWQVPGHSYQVRQPSRVLFIGSDPSSTAPKRWNQVTVIYGDHREPYPAPRSSWANSYIWPYPPLFCTWRVNGDTLEIIPTDPWKITRIARTMDYKVAIIKEAGRKPRSDLLAQAWSEQIRALQKGGLPIHVELSATSNLGMLKSCLTPGRWSVSLNQDDLLKITAQEQELSRYIFKNQKVDPFIFKARNLQEPMFDRFIRAKSLLQFLGARWIYVHGNELDIAVWRSSDEDENLGEKLRDAMLLAKAVVVAAMIIRSTPPLMFPVIQRTLQGSTLAPKGFWALFEFVSDFAPWIAVRHSIDPKMVRDAFLSLTGNCGWYQGPVFGVAVAPVFWPDVAKLLNATGAGDYSSAVVAAYVWGR